MEWILCSEKILDMWVSFKNLIPRLHLLDIDKNCKWLEHLYGLFQTHCKENLKATIDISVQKCQLIFQL